MITLRSVTASDAHLLAELHIASWRVAYRGLLRDEYLDGPIEPIVKPSGLATP